VSPDHQILDFNPGFGPEAPFWTTPLPASAMGIDLAAATASFSATDLAVPEFHDVISALTHQPAQPGVVSFDVRWGGRTKAYTVRDAANGYAGGFVEGVVSIAWTGEAGGYRFVSDPASTSQSLFAIIGHERNGVYFS
jgi:hypothetical protein